MREIKVKIWDSENRFMITEFDNDFNNLSFISLSNEGKISVGAYDKSEDWYELDVLEYIGQLDKNHSEIFEGDILREEIDGVNFIEGEPDVDFIYYVVVYIEEYAAFCLLGKDEYEDYLENDIQNFDNAMRDTYGIDGIEQMFICGNIFETPEKLK